MSGHEELFGLFGFEKKEDNLWIFSRTVEGIETTTARVVVHKNDDNEFTGYLCEEDHIPEAALYFKSEDFRDMVALAQNEIAVAEEQATHGCGDEGFSSNGWFISKCFMNGDHFDYDIDGRSPRSKLTRLKSPAAAFGEDYTSWRDDFCERVLAAPKTVFYAG